jgi:hypothetical protein
VSVEADGSTVDGTAAGVGVASAVAINKATSVNEAYLGGTHETPSLMIQAHTRTLNEGQSSEDETNTFSSVAVSGAGAKEVGVAGALALNLTDSKTAALIGGQAYVEMPYSGNVVLSASDKTGDRARATPHETATGETVGVGASVAVNVAVRTTLAELSNGAQITDGWDPAVRGDLTVTAASDHSMETEAIAGASGGVATTAASAVSLSENATTARLGGRPFVDPNEVTYIDGDLIISADSKESVSTLARGSSQGNDLSIGAAVAIALVDSTSQAEADRNVTTHGDAGIAISAQGLNRIDTQAIAGELGGKRKDASTPEDGVDQNIQKQTDLAGKKKAEAKGEAASGGSEEGSGGGRVVFSGGSQDGDQDQGEDEDEDKKEDQDDGQDDDKSDPQDDATGGLDLFRGPRGR